jgi:hypothetical protein
MLTASPQAGLTDPGLPPAVAKTLTSLRDELLASVGGNLTGLVLYGGLARGRYRPGYSDVNVVVLLRELSPATLTAVAPPLRRAWRAAAVEPLLLTPAEVRAAADAFAIKFLDIKEHHVLLHGEDPFADLIIDRRCLRRHVEQELNNLALRGRRRWLALHDDAAGQAAALRGIARPLALALGALLRLAAKKVPPDDRTKTIFETAAVVFGLDGPVLAALAALRAEPVKPARVPALFAAVLLAIQRAAEAAAHLPL